MSSSALPTPLPEVVENWRSWAAGRRFVWALVPPWHGVWTRQQHFTLRLAALGAEILYIESPPSLVTAARKGQWADFLPRARREQVVRGIEVISPPAQLPGSLLSDGLARLGGLQATIVARRAIARRGWSDGDYVAWHRVPASRYLAAALRPRATVYDVTDDYPLYVDHPRRRRLVRERDDWMTREADLVLVASSSLLAPRTALNRNTHTVLNGVDFDLFHRVVTEQGLAEHPALRGVARPRIGYVGLVSHWTDLDLVEAMAKRWPGQVVMAGPVAPEVRARVKEISGVHWLGFVDRTELPTLISGFDVVTLPRLVNDLTNRQNPLKIWEYLATGKPFVSCDLAALEPCRDLVDIATTCDSFLDAIGRRLEEPDDRADDRIALARTRSWDVLFDQMMAHLSQL